jgi:hypothetical protein
MFTANYAVIRVADIQEPTSKNIPGFNDSSSAQ